MPPASLAGTVDESKAKRQERLTSRFRDRGGIFVPSEGNALVDILLSRSVNGESPLKKRTPRKKSTSTPKTRPPSSAAASRLAGSKTPRAGAPKRASRKSAVAPSDADENNPPRAKKRHNTSKRAKLSESRRTPDMDPRTRAGPSHRTTAQRVPFADQLADAINSIKTRTVPDPSSASEKIKHPTTATPPPLGKSERALGKRNAQATAALPPRYSAGPEPSGLVSEGTARKVKSPLVLVLEKQQRERQDGQRRAGEVAAAASELAKSYAPHESDESESDDSDVPLAMKSAKRTPAVAGSRTKPNKGKGSAPQPPTGRRSKAKARERGVGLPDEAANRAETIAPPRAKKGGAAEERVADPDTVAVAVGRCKVAPDADADLPPPLTTHAGANSNGRKKVQVLQEKSTPANAPRKRKERIKTLLDPSAKDENEHEPPRKKSRRADPSTRSRGAKENKEMSRTAREAAKIVMDKPLPSPVKQPAARPKPASKAKKPASSRACTAQAPRSRGLPRDILRRIKVNAQALPALNDIDDDDPIDFLRS